MGNYSASRNSSLPQMKSIWLDEDDDIEKLYNLESETFLANANEGQDLQLYVMNSIYVESKQGKRDLLPVTPEMQKDGLLNESYVHGNPSSESGYVVGNGSGSSSSIRGKLLGKLKKKWNELDTYRSSQKDQKILKDQITGPFHFQHIIHANIDSSIDDTKPLVDEDSKTHIKEDGDNNKMMFSKAYCTEEIPSMEFDWDYDKIRISDTTNLSFEMEKYLKTNNIR